MKKTFPIVTTIALVLTICFSTLNAAAANPATGNGNTQNSNTTAQYGRLAIASAGIDVALYNSYAQSVCDAEDSACFYYNNGLIIADHNYQAFETLTSVQIGDIATITRTNGTVVTLQCVEAFDGHNTTSDITDADYNPVAGQHDYLTYTCLENDKNVHVCQWDIISNTATK